MPQNQTGGAQAPDSYGGNTNQGSGNAGPNRKNRRRRNGRVEYRWPNGTWHTRPFGKQHRSNYGDSNGGGQNTGGNENNSSSGPSKHPYLDMARNDARIAYGPAEQSLAQRGLAIPAWFENYRQQIAQQQTAAKQYGDPIVQNAQAQATAAGQVAPGVDANSQAGQDATLAAAARAALGNSFVTMLQGFGRVQNDYLTGRQTVATTAELGEQQQLARDRTALKKEKGAYIQSQRQKRKEEARQRQLENQAFGLDVAREANDQANADADRAADRKADKNKVITSGPFAGMTNGEVRNLSSEEKARLRRQYKAKGGKDDEGGGSNFTPTQRSAARAKVRRGIALVKSQIGKVGYKPEGFWRRAYDGLVQEKGYDPLIARAAIQIMRTGRVQPKLAAKLKKDYGITGGALAGKRVKLPPAASDVPVVGDIIGQSPLG